MTTSEAPPGELRQNIEYAHSDGQSLKLDAFVPAGAGPFPAAIVVHGGAWVAGDRRWNVEPLLPPLAEAGCAWFSISIKPWRSPARPSPSIHVTNTARNSPSWNK